MAAPIDATEPMFVVPRLGQKLPINNPSAGKHRGPDGSQLRPGLKQSKPRIIRALNRAPVCPQPNIFRQLFGFTGDLA
jgi:hypothetical protein